MFEPLTLKISEQPLLQAEDYLFETFGNFGALEFSVSLKTITCRLFSRECSLDFSAFDNRLSSFPSKKHSCKSLFFSLLNYKLPLNMRTERKHSNTCRWHRESIAMFIFIDFVMKFFSLFLFCCDVSFLDKTCKMTCIRLRNALTQRALQIYTKSKCEFSMSIKTEKK